MHSFYRESQFLQYYIYYTYYMYYHGSTVQEHLFLSILHTLHILHVLPGVPVFLRVRFCNITHITCITRGPCFLKLKFCNITYITCITRGPIFLETEISQYYIYYTYYIPLQPTTCPISAPQQASTRESSF